MSVSLNARNSGLRLLVFGAVALGAVAASADDHTNLDDGLPVEVADARAADYLSTEAQLLSSYELERDGSSLLHLEPRLEVGVAHNMEVTLHAPLVTNLDDAVGLGRVEVAALYNFNQETLILPAVSLAGAVEAPSLIAGDDAAVDGGDGFDPALRLLASKSIPGVPLLASVHANGELQYNADRKAAERFGRYRVVVGASVNVSASLIAVADVLREQRMQDDEEVNLVEVGARFRVTPLFILVAGAGVGFGDESPITRATVGLQYRVF